MQLTLAVQPPCSSWSWSWSRFHLPASTKGRTQIVMMGGGPRTYPGGVSKWQWKKMQDKKAKQLLKARLVRERQLYEMRKRAELKSVDLQKPWEKTATAPTLFAVTADDQLQAMAERFVRRGAIDLWTEQDGPNSQFITVDGKPSSRVFPRDALHSTQPYTITKSPQDHPLLGGSNRYTSSPPPPPPPPTQQQQSSENSKPRRGKSQSHSRSNNLEIKTRGPSMAARSGHCNYNYTPKTKANHRLNDYVREPLYADGDDHSHKTKVHVPKSGIQTFAGFNLSKRSGQRLTESPHKSKMDAHSRLK